MNLVSKLFGKCHQENQYEQLFCSHKIIGFLGGGSYGKVYKVQESSSRQEYALKVVELKLRNVNYALKIAEREVVCLRKLVEFEHPNILRYVSSGVLGKWPHIKSPAEPPITILPFMFIITELCHCTLKDKLEKDRNDENKNKAAFLLEMKRFALQLADALKLIHEREIMHRDLNPSNIFLQGDVAKIGDFGFSRFPHGHQLGDNNSTTTGYRVGSYNYQSPRQRSGLANTFMCDVYSLGVTYFEMIHPNLIQPDRDTMKELYDDNLSASSRVLEEIHAHDLKLLIVGMLSHSEGIRPSAKDVYEQLRNIA